MEWKIEFDWDGPTSLNRNKQITFCPETDFCLVIRYSFPMLTSITSLLLGLFSSVVTILAWLWWDRLACWCSPTSMPQKRFKDEVSMDKRGSSGSCDSCHTYIWLFPGRLMFLQMVSALLIHSAKTSGQQLFPLHRQATQDSHHGCSGDFDSFWFREITRQSGETSWSPNVMGLLWHGTSVWYWGRLRGEEKQNRVSSVFPAHFPSSTGRKLLSLKVQSAVKMDMAKHCLPYLVRVLVKESTGIGS